jgi:uncharacterized delta-60 repeat protein
MSPPLHPLAGNIFELQPLEIRRLLNSATIDSGGILHVVGTGSSETITLNQLSNGKVSISGVGTQFTPGSQFTRILIEAGGGNDTVQIFNNVIYTSATITGNAGNDTITGGRSNDTIYGRDNNDNLFGGPGNDFLDGNAGNDLMVGDDGRDVANYSDRASAVHVILDDLANDGQVNIGEDDNVQTDEVFGGAGNDTLTGSAGNDFFGGGAGGDILTGREGGDQLTGSSGSDQLFGKEGNDYLLAQNNDRDTVNGGSNTDGTSDLDFASIDTIDVGSAPTTLRATAPGPVAPRAAAATSGSQLDSTYGTGGKAVADRLGWFPSASAVDGQGRVYFVGSRFSFDSLTGAAGNDFVVARCTPDGAFDVNYGEKVVDFTGFNGTGAGYNDDDDALGVAVDPANNVLVVGGSAGRFAVARLTEDGALDTSFNDTGMQEVDFGSGYGAEAHDVAVQADGKIVLVGSAQTGDGSTDFAVARLLDNGLIDSELNDGAGSFNGGGTNTLNVGVNGNEFDDATAVAFQGFGIDEGAQRIVVGGSSNGDFALGRFNADGSVDGTFGGQGQGYVRTDLGFDETLNDLAVNSLNQVVAVGSSSNFIPRRPAGDVVPLAAADTVDAVMAVYAPDGDVAPVTRDQPPTGGFVASFNAVAVDAKNRIVVAGADANDFVVARFLPDLSFDTGFENGLVHTDFSADPQQFQQPDVALGLGILSDGKIVAGGTTDTNGDGGIVPVAARYVGEGSSNVPPGSIEAEVTEVEQFATYDDLHAKPPTPPLDAYLGELSEDGRLYQLSQPDNDGVARIDLANGPDGNGNNVIKLRTIVAEDGTTNVAVDVDGVVLYYDASTTTRIEINARGGNDLVCAGDGVTVPLLIDGGDGNDVIVGGRSHDLLFGGAGRDLINGEHGADVLLGGADEDLLYGDEENDILIGGTGRDALLGGPGEDILIGGTTAYDADAAALESLRAEWASSGSIAVRIDHVRNGGGLNGTSALTTGAGGTVFDDDAMDFLTNDQDRDWFFYRKTGKDHDVVLVSVRSDEVSPL